MSAVSTFVLSAGYVLSAVWELARYAIRFGWALLLPKALLAGRLVAVQSHLAVELNGSGGGKKRRRHLTLASGSSGWCSRSCWMAGRTWCTS